MNHGYRQFAKRMAAVCVRTTKVHNPAVVLNNGHSVPPILAHLLISPSLIRSLLSLVHVSTTIVIVASSLFLTLIRLVQLAHLLCTSDLRLQQFHTNVFLSQLNRLRHIQFPPTRRVPHQSGASSSSNSSVIRFWSWTGCWHFQGDHFPDHIKFPDFSSRGRQRISINCLTLWSAVVVSR